MANGTDNVQLRELGVGIGRRKTKSKATMTGKKKAR